MAGTFFLPVLNEEQYRAFRAEIGNELADTYDKWVEHHKERVYNAKRRGETVVPIDVDFDAFVSFCRASNAPRNLETLEDFAREKGAGQV